MREVIKAPKVKNQPAANRLELLEFSQMGWVRPRKRSGDQQLYIAATSIMIGSYADNVLTAARKRYIFFKNLSSMEMSKRKQCKAANRAP